MSHDFRIVDNKNNTLTTEGIPFNMQYYGGNIRCDNNLQAVNIHEFEFNMTYNYSIIIRKIPCFKKNTIKFLYYKDLKECKEILSNACRYIVNRYKKCMYKNVRGARDISMAMYDIINNMNSDDIDLSKFEKYSFTKNNIKYYDITKIDPSDDYCYSRINKFIGTYPDKLPTITELQLQPDVIGDYWIPTPENVRYQLNHILECLNWIEIYLPKKFDKCHFIGD